MEPSLSAGSSQRGASVKWTAKLIWPAGGGSAAVARLAAHARQTVSNATKSPRPCSLFTAHLSPSSPSPCPLPLRGRGMHRPLPLAQGEGRVGVWRCAHARAPLSLAEGEGRGEGARER